MGSAGEGVADQQRQPARDHHCWSEVFVSVVYFPDLRRKQSITHDSYFSMIEFKKMYIFNFIIYGTVSIVSKIFVYICKSLTEFSEAITPVFSVT